MSKPLKSFYEATRYLGQYIGKKVPFLLATSCMSEQRRHQIAVITWLIDSKKASPQMLSMLQIDIMPLLEKLGYAEWIRDTVTDMAIRKGLSTDLESFFPEEGDKVADLEGTGEASESDTDKSASE